MATSNPHIGTNIGAQYTVVSTSLNYEELQKQTLEPNLFIVYVPQKSDTQAGSDGRNMLCDDDNGIVKLFMTDSTGNLLPLNLC